MNNFPRNIPACAFVNAQVIQSLKQDDIARAVSAVRAHYGMEPHWEWSLTNPAHVASLLYCLIVVPKEIWDPPSNDNIFKELETSKPLDLFTVPRWAVAPNEHPLRDFIRHLRNAVSHARFSVNGNQDFEFWDEWQGCENYRVSITRDNLAKFLSIVGAQLANLRNR